MTRIVVLFNLQEGVDVAEYEAWAKTSDIPTVRGLKSTDGFTVHKAMGLFGKDDPSPYEYIEIIDVNDMGVFGEELATETMRKVASEYQRFAEAPVFILTESLD